MKKILEIINLADSARGFIGNQFSFLQKNGGYEMHLICTPDEAIDAFVKQHDVRYKPITIERQLNIVKDLKAIFEISRYIRRYRIDIVIGHQAKGMLLAMFAATIARAPYKIIMAHGVLVDTMHGLKKSLMVFEERFIARLADITICVSDSVRQRRLEEGIDRAEKQVIIGDGTCNGVDAINQFNPQNIDVTLLTSLRAQFKLTENDYVIGFCGRMVKDKGIVELIDAFSIVAKTCSNAKLLIIGPKEQRDSIPAETYDIIEKNNRIIFTGSVDRYKMQCYYALMDSFVLPSYREGFPTVVLEASAMSIPVITTKATGCIDSIIDGETGLFVDIDASSIANAIIELNDKQKGKDIGSRGRELVLRKYEHQIVCSNMLSFFDNLTRRSDKQWR